MRQMQRRRRVLFYHSNTAVPGVAGLAEVVAQPTPTRPSSRRSRTTSTRRASREQPRWWLVDVGFERKFERVVTLDAAQGQRGQARRLRAAAARHPPVGAAGDRGAVAAHPLPRMRQDPDVARTKASAARARRPRNTSRTAASSASAPVPPSPSSSRRSARMKPHRGRGVELGTEHAPAERARHPGARPQRDPGRWRSTSTAPTNAIRTTA